MKKTIKLFAFILATLMLVSFIPLAAFADEIETVAEIEENENTSDTEYEETETLIFEFIGDICLPSILRVAKIAAKILIVFFMFLSFLHFKITLKSVLTRISGQNCERATATFFE